jgi:hypothetical protein
MLQYAALINMFFSSLKIMSVKIKQRLKMLLVERSSSLKNLKTLKGIAHQKLTGVESASMNRSSFKLW